MQMKNFQILHVTRSCGIEEEWKDKHFLIYKNRSVPFHLDQF